MKKIKIISLFSGAGGLDLGFEKTNKFETSIALEFNPSYAKTLFINQGNHFFSQKFLENTKIIIEDVSKLNGHDLISSSSITKDDIFGIVGGPPCQSFSIMGGRNGLNDDRGNLTFDFIRLVFDTKPNFFVFENVPNLFSISNGIIFKDIISKFSELGYNLNYGILDSSRYGAWTFRKRLIIVGSLEYKITLPAYTHNETSTNDLFGNNILPLKKVGDLLNQLPNPDSTEARSILNHTKVNHSQEVVERFNKLKPGEKDEIRRRYRLNANKPANTVVSGGEGGYLMNIHPYEPRELTLRESALIQGFPINYEFNGIPREIAKQIANSVPVELAEAIAKQIYKYYKH